MMLNCLFAAPLSAMVLTEDIFFFEEERFGDLPTLLFAVAIGAMFALFVALTSENEQPPLYSPIIPGIGFSLALVFIYATTTEIVAIMRVSLFCHESGDAATARPCNLAKCAPSSLKSLDSCQSSLRSLKPIHRPPISSASALSQTFGTVLGLSEAIIGMTVLGIGNGIW